MKMRLLIILVCTILLANCIKNERETRIIPKDYVFPKGFELLELAPRTTGKKDYLFVPKTIPVKSNRKNEEKMARYCIAKCNLNSPSDYRLIGYAPKKNNFSFTFISTRGYKYAVKFMSGNKFEMSSPGWGRLKPSGTYTINDIKTSVRFYDPGFQTTFNFDISKE